MCLIGNIQFEQYSVFSFEFDNSFIGIVCKLYLNEIKPKKKKYVATTIKFLN